MLRRAWTLARRHWPWIKYLVGIALAALAADALLGRRGELSGATGYLDHLDWCYVALAALAEIGSLIAFAFVQKRLLAAADVPMSNGRAVGITLGSTAIANSMPAGPLVSAVFAFGQYRRSGADDVTSSWTLVATFVAASVSLAAFAAAGVSLAGGQSAGLDLVVVTVAVFVLSLLVGAVFVQRRLLAFVVRAALRASARVVRWPRGDVAASIDGVINRLTAVRLDGRAVGAVGGWAMANWVLDCACLVLAFLAVHSAVPWRGLLLAYGAGQLAANLPITPGGLGVVEGSLTIALVAFGGAETSTVAAVLLYRIMSFWSELPVGWAVWGAMTWATRREHAATSAADSSGTVVGGQSIGAAV